MKRSHLWGLATLVILGILAFPILKLILSEDKHPEKDTIEWHILFVGSLIKDVPLTGIVGKPEYYYSYGDGPKPHENAMRFFSTETVDSLKKKMEDYVVSCGFSKAPDSDNHREGDSYRKETSMLDLLVETQDGKTVVVIKEFP